jgi:hypothetical protein
MANVTTSDWRTVRRNPVLVVWCLFVFTIPFYFADSGLPQPGNLLIFILFPSVMARWNGRLFHQFNRPFLLLAALTAWVFIVDEGWFLVAGNWTTNGYYSSLTFPIYFIYNLAVFLCALALFQRFGDLFVKCTLYTVVACVAAQATFSLLTSDGSRVRDELFFNNANQLGFYSLLAACMIAIAQRRLKFGMMKAGAALLCCAYLAFVSASRAAVGGIVILFFLLVFANPRIVVIASLAALGFISLGGPLANAIDATEQRIEYRRRESLVTGRAYDRIYRYPQHLLIGAGEGNTMRFAEKEIKAIEIHSSFGTILFCYGIVGLALFLAFLWSILRQAPIRVGAMILPVLAYSLTHQGLRTTSFWILLAMLLVVVPRKVREKRAIAPALPLPPTVWVRKS